MAIDKIAVEVGLETQNAEQKYNKLIAEFNDKGKEIKKRQVKIDKTDIDKIKTDIVNVNNQINRLKVNKVKLEADVSRLNALREELAKTEDMILKLKRVKVNMELAGEPTKKIKEVGLAIRELSQTKAEINAKIDGLEKAEKDLNYFYDLLKRRADLEIQIKNYEGNKEKLEQLQAEADSLNG